MIFCPHTKLLFACFKTLLELVNTTTGIDKLLLAGVEGVALGANFNVNIAALGGLRLYDLTACTNNLASLVLGMDALFHFFHLR